MYFYRPNNRQFTILKWHKITDQSTFWELPLENFSIINEDSKFDIPLNITKPIIIDSGTSFIMMPVQDRDTMLLQFWEKIDIYCDVSSAYPSCVLKQEQTFSDFPDMKFTIDGQSYFLPRESYVVN